MQFGHIALPADRPPRGRGPDPGAAPCAVQSPAHARRGLHDGTAKACRRLCPTWLLRSGAIIEAGGVETTVVADVPAKQHGASGNVQRVSRLPPIHSGPEDRGRSSHDRAVQRGKSRDPGGDAVAADDRADAGRRAGEDEISGLEFHQGGETGEDSSGFQIIWPRVPDCRLSPFTSSVIEAFSRGSRRAAGTRAPTGPEASKPLAMSQGLPDFLAMS